MTSSTNTSFAEVIESSLELCKVQTWQWDNAPCFGSLVTIQEADQLLFGVVYTIQTASSDPSRTPFIYQKTHEELMRDQPQIFMFLKTTFSCLILGSLEKNSISYTIASKPARIHAFVQHADSELAEHFFSNIAYLDCLFGIHGSIPLMDELLLALIQHQKNLPRARLHTFMQTYMIRIGSDYRRARIFARRLSQIVSYAV
jgi:hypothetical protein